MVTSLLLTFLALSYTLNGGSEVNLNNPNYFSNPTDSIGHVDSTIGNIQNTTLVNSFTGINFTGNVNTEEVKTLFTLRYGFYGANETYYHLFDYVYEMHYITDRSSFERFWIVTKMNQGTWSYQTTLNDLKYSYSELDNLSNNIGVTISCFVYQYVSGQTLTESTREVIDLNNLSGYYRKYATHNGSYRGSTYFQFNVGVSFIELNDSSYSLGFTDGVNSVDTQSYYDTGFETGRLVGQQDNKPIATLFNAIVNLPFYMVNNLFGYELYGLNLYAMLSSLITLAIMLYILRKTLLK